MRDERGKVAGDVIVYEPYTLWGAVGGSVKVIDGGKFYCRGTIYGNLDVETGGRVHIFGNILGNLTVAAGAKVIHEGIIGGDATNDGGRLYIESHGKIGGKVRTKAGDTVERKTKTPPPEAS